MAQAVEDHGRLDILVNNAGTTQVIAHPDLEAATPEVWRRIFDVNVIGTWQVTVAAVPHLRASGDGRHRERVVDRRVTPPGGARSPTPRPRRP